MNDIKMHYTLGLTHNKTKKTEVIVGKLSIEKSNNLSNFVKYSKDLLKSTFLRNNYSFSASFGEEMSYKVKELPTDEELAYFLHKFRPFYLNDEPTNFLRICNTLSKAFDHKLIRLIIKEQKNNYLKTVTSSMWKWTTKGVILNSENMLDKWLKGFEYHKDIEKRRYIEKLHDDFYPLEFNKIQFYSMLKDKTRAIRYMANMIKKIKRKYNKDEVHNFVKNIPSGKISTASMIAKALGLEPKNYQRCVGKEVCKCDTPGRYRVVIKTGWRFPHKNNIMDCDVRAKQLRDEDITISEDNKFVRNAEKYLYP